MGAIDHRMSVTKLEWNGRSSTLRMIAPAVLGLLLVQVWSGCGRKEQAAESITDIQKREGIPVRVRKMAPCTLRRIEALGGTAEGIAQATVESGVPGRIVSVKVVPGSRVKQGAVLVIMDPDIASPLEMARAQHGQTERSLNRIKALADEGGVSREVVEQVETAYAVAKEQLSAAREAVQLVAPFAGTVLEVMQPVNRKIGSGAPVVKMARMDKMRVELSANESVAGSLAKGQRAFVVADGDTVWGRLEEVSLGADEASHAFAVTAVFGNPGMKIKPGTYVTVSVITQELKDVLSLSLETVDTEDGRHRVYVVRDKSANLVDVELGIRGNRACEVRSGLHEGDMVVVGGASLLRDGSSVLIVE